MSDHYYRSDFDFPRPGGIDLESRFLFGDPWDHNSRENVEPSAEFDAYWASLTIGQKIRGTLLSLLIGGGTGALIGYIMMY